MVKTISTAEVFTVIAFACASLLPAQTPPVADSPVIRVETREVPVDVAVTAKKGPAPGILTTKDFFVWEDGKPQKIDSVISASSDPETSLKHFVLYFDFSSVPLSDQAESEKAAATFVEGLASPDRYMAVMNMTASGPRVLQDFTVARPALLKAVAKVQNAQGGRNGSGSGSSGNLPESLATVCHSMVPASGRKALLLFTGGHSDFSGAIPEAFKTSIAACNRANVAIYVIAGNDLVAPTVRNGPPQMNTITQQTPQDASADFGRLMAEGTGGISLTIGNLLKDQLAAIAREQDEYYRVFYTPPPSKEGACHTLRVEVDTHGVDTRARKEYCTDKPVDLVAGKIAGQALEAGATMAADAATASMQLPYFYTGTNRASVHLSLDLKPASLNGQIDLVGTVFRSDGSTVARFADTRAVDVAPWHYEKQFTVPSGTYTFQLAIGAGPNAFAKLHAPLNVESWNAAKPGMGSLMFATEVLPANSGAAASASVAPILEGQGPLMVGGRQFVPAAANRFNRSDQVSFYTEFYVPELDGANPQPKMEYCIQDRKTNEVKGCSDMVSLADFIHAGNPVVPFGTRLPAVAQLPAGSYRLEVRAVIASSPEKLARAIDFEIN